MESTFDVAVAGLGINGLCAAYHLSKNKDIKILLLEQFDVGHTNGSSHSQIRIIRSAYKDSLYTELTLQAKEKYWPELQETLGTKLINDNRFIIFGEHKPTFEEYKSSVGTKGFENLVLISGEQAQQRFPEMKLAHYQHVILDTKAGVIEAHNTLSSIYTYLKTLPNVTIRSNTKLLNHISQNGIVTLQLQNQKLTTKKLIITAGRWVKQLLPQLAEHFNVNQQFITYLQFDGPEENFRLGKFPTWMTFDESRQFWALPAFGSDWIKFGRHINLMNSIEANEEERLKEMEQFSKTVFTRPFKKVQKVEKCYYTSTIEEDFVIDFIDEDKNVLVGSICSGHAFKFGPVSGLILSEMIQTGKSTVEAFQNKVHQFSIAYEKELRNKPKNH